MPTARAVAVLVAMSFAMPAAAAAGPKPEQDKVVIAVGGRSLFYYLPLTLADRLGYFKDEGLNVEIADFPGGAKALQAMIGGSADVVSGAYEHVIDMHAKGIEVQEFVVQDRYNGIVVGLSKEKARAYKSPKDLRGLKIGVTAPGSSTNFLINALLARDGLAPDAVSIIGVGASSGAVAAMQKGQIDGLSNLDPVITRLEKSGDLVPVVDTRTAAAMKDVYGGAYAAGCLYAHTDYLRKNPKTPPLSPPRWCAPCSGSPRPATIRSSRRCLPSITGTIARSTRPPSSAIAKGSRRTGATRWRLRRTSTRSSRPSSRR